jgi:hypothetical protein
MDRFSITSTAGMAALGALLLVGAGPILASQAAAKDQSRLPTVRVEPSRLASVEQPTSTRVVSFRFADCLAILADVAQEQGVTPVTLVSTADLQVARIEAADGAVTISCDRAAGRMALTKSQAPTASAVVATR